MMKQDLGQSVEIEDCYHEGELMGFDYWHDCIGKRAYGFIPIGPPSGWTLVSLEPLTIRPSMLCKTCGHHGFVTNGRWEPCP